MDQLEGRALGPYVIERRLGGGGMANVYLGHHRLLEQPRAIKVMSSHLLNHDGYVQLFYREAKLAAGLRHPNIVQIHDVGEERGLPYIVMELLQGRSLRDLIRSGDLIPLSRAVHFVRQLADALDYAHQHGVAHRDVKPGNVFVGPDDRLTLVDFGISRAADSTRLTVTHGIGTPEYMAPESFDERLARPGADGHALGVDTDLYALGVVAYELLAGQAPFSGRTPQAIMFGQVHHAPPPLRLLRPEVPEHVETVVLRQLAKDPRSRLGPPSVFAAALADAARLDDVLSESRTALDTGDLDRAERLLTEARSVDPELTVLEPLWQELADRRIRQQRRTDAQHLLDQGDWRAALEQVHWLEAAVEPGVAPLMARVNALRESEAIRMEAERRVMAEEIAAKRRRESEEEAVRRVEAATEAAREQRAEDVRRERRANVVRLLAGGDWREALGEIQLLEQAGETDLAGFRQLAESIRDRATTQAEAEQAAAAQQGEAKERPPTVEDSGTETFSNASASAKPTNPYADSREPNSATAGKRPDNRTAGQPQGSGDQRASRSQAKVQPSRQSSNSAQRTTGRSPDLYETLATTSGFVLRIVVALSLAGVAIAIGLSLESARIGAPSATTPTAGNSVVRNAEAGGLPKPGAGVTLNTATPQPTVSSAPAASVASTTALPAITPRPTDTRAPTITPTLTADQDWQATQAELGAHWESDWEGAIGILDRFLGRHPGHAEAIAKLSAAWISWGDQGAKEGMPYTASTRYRSAEGLGVDAPTARARLLALTPTATPTPKPGDVLLADNFDDPGSGPAGRSTRSVSYAATRFTDGELVIEMPDPASTVLATWDVAGSYRDASIAVDVRRIRATGRGSIDLACRRDATAQGIYRGWIDVGNGTAGLSRWDKNQEVVLRAGQASSAIRQGIQSNRMELRCAGNAISLLVNGTMVASATDSTYAEGRFWIGVGAYKDSSGVFELHVDNLEITQR